MAHQERLVGKKAVVFPQTAGIRNVAITGSIGRHHFKTVADYARLPESSLPQACYQAIPGIGTAVHEPVYDIVEAPATFLPTSLRLIGLEGQSGVDCTPSGGPVSLIQRGLNHLRGISETRLGQPAACRDQERIERDVHRHHGVSDPDVY